MPYSEDFNPMYFDTEGTTSGTEKNERGRKGESLRTEILFVRRHKTGRETFLGVPFLDYGDWLSVVPVLKTVVGTLTQYFICKVLEGSQNTHSNLRLGRSRLGSSLLSGPVV